MHDRARATGARTVALSIPQFALELVREGGRRRKGGRGRGRRRKEVRRLDIQLMREVDMRLAMNNPLQMLDYESLKTRKAKVNKGLRLVS